MSSRQHPFSNSKLGIKAIANLFSSLFSNVFSHKWGRKFVSFFLAGALISVTMAACTATTETASNNAPQSAGSGKKDVELTLVSFAVTKQAHEAIIPKFVEKWQKEKKQKRKRAKY